MRIRAAVLLIVIIITGCATNQTSKNSVIPAASGSLSAVHGISSGQSSAPENGYTWQQLVNLVTASNPDYAAILAEANAQYYKYKSKTDLKDLEASFEYAFLSNEMKNFQYGFGLSFSVPNPFTNSKNTRTGEAARRETEAEAAILRKKIAITIYSLVQEITIGERQLAILQTREQILSDREENMKLRNAAHLVSQADLLSFNIQHLNLKSSMQQTRSTINAARKSLLALVQIPDKQLVLAGIPTDWNAILKLLDNEQKLIENALSNSPELAVANAAYEKACAMLGVVKAKQIPWFDTVGVSYIPRFTESMVYNYSGVLIPTTKMSDKWKINLSMSLPVFVWFSSEKKQAKTEVDAAFLRMSGIRQRVQNDISEIITELRDSLNIYNDYRSAFSSIPEPARESFPDSETYYKQLDNWLSASEYALKTELRCAQIYSKLLEASGEW